MSISNHNAPIQTLNNSKSNRSLYTENSQDSEIEGRRRQQQNKQSGRKQQPISSKIGKLPSIIPHQANKQPSAPRQRNRDAFDGMPTLPVKNILNNRYRQNEQQFNSKSFHMGRIGGAQFNTIAVANLQQNQVKNAYQPQINAMRMTGVNAFSSHNQQSQRSRMLRSSQGGRWFRSQSLMQDKDKSPQRRIMGGSNNIQMMTRNFHKHESKYIEKVQNLIKYYTNLQKQLQQKNDIFFKFKIRLSDSLQDIKNKMQNYLQLKIDLSNLPIDRPDTDWGQEQLMKFYTNYNQILKQRWSLKQEQTQKQKFTTVLKKYKNCSYYGSVKDGKKHGFGYLHYFSGRFFQGLFEYDQKVRGFQMDDSELYLGYYDKNQRHGQGILKTNQYLLSGLFYNGQFKAQLNSNQANLSNGFTNQPKQAIIRKGFKIQYSSITFYPGSTKIVQKNNNNDIFIGEVNEQGQKHGQGLQIFSNGDLYIGQYQQGTPQGYGQYYWDSGAFYRGNFLTGMRHGKGVWMMVHGDRYEGDYLNDKKNGKGVYTWKSGDRYKGQFENDYRHGYGQMYWRDGTSYKGQWLNGIQANKNFKLEDEPKQYASKVTQPSSTKNYFRTIQTKVKKSIQQATNKSISRNARKSQTIQQTLSQPPKNPYLQKNKKIPLQKLKAMLNPSNSIN